MEQKETSGHLRPISTVDVTGAGPAGLAAALKGSVDVTQLQEPYNAHCNERSLSSSEEIAMTLQHEGLAEAQRTLHQPALASPRVT